MGKIGAKWESFASTRKLSAPVVIPPPLREQKAATRKRSVARKARGGCIYFLRCEQFIKIGFSAGSNAYFRLKSAQTGNPFPVVEVAKIEGEQSLERWLHVVFHSCHHRGEWFCLEGDIAEVVKGIADLPYNRAAEWVLRWLERKGRSLAA